MMNVAVRIRELVSSNLDTLLNKAEDERKMLRLLETEVEEALIALHGDLAKAERTHERKTRTTEALALNAENWTAKAKTAVDHKREDLARAALLARESERLQVHESKAELEKLAGEISEIKAAIAELEAKRADVTARTAEGQRANAQAPSPQTPKNSRAAKTMDRIGALDRRISFAGDDSASLDPSAVDAQIAALSADSAIDAELAAMKKPAAKGASKKAE
ncbi:MAG: PspA/IM30 family protein [Erythrobacter sp.]